MNLHQAGSCSLVCHVPRADLSSILRDETRGIVYSLLSAAFRDEPSQKLLDYIKSNTDQIIDFLGLYNEPRSCRCVQGLKQLAGYEAHNPENLFPLREEFDFLFLNPDGINPFESVYRSLKKQVMGKPWEQVKNFYQSTCLNMRDNKEHLEDHASVELEFMARLAFMSAQVSSEGPDKAYRLFQVQEHFLTQHLLCWFPELCGDIQSMEAVHFYNIISSIGENWVVMDNQFLKHGLDQ